MGRCAGELLRRACYLSAIFGRGAESISSITGEKRSHFEWLRGACEVGTSEPVAWHTRAMSPPLAEQRLRLLHLEDSELDHHLTLAHLRRGGLDVDAVRTDSEYQLLLQRVRCQE